MCACQLSRDSSTLWRRTRRTRTCDEELESEEDEELEELEVEEEEDDVLKLGSHVLEAGEQGLVRRHTLRPSHIAGSTGARRAVDQQLLGAKLAALDNVAHRKCAIRHRHA